MGVLEYRALSSMCTGAVRNVAVRDKNIWGMFLVCELSPREVCLRGKGVRGNFHGMNYQVMSVMPVLVKDADHREELERSG